MVQPFVSMLMPVHNAPEYVEKAIRSIGLLTPDVDYELIVVDNASDEPTRALLTSLKAEGLITKLDLRKDNTLFAGGNNIAAKLADPKATHFAMLNSDIEVKSPNWLSQLLKVHERGVTTYGIVLDPLRVDSYALIIDADLYRANPLDEGHQWWWAVSKQQAALLREGHSVQGYAEHEQYVHHFGGKSGDAYKHARGMDVSRDEVYEWFAGHEAKVLDRKKNGQIPGYEDPNVVVRAARRLKRLLTPSR